MFTENCETVYVLPPSQKTHPSKITLQVEDREMDLATCYLTPSEAMRLATALMEAAGYERVDHETAASLLAWKPT